MEAAKEFLTRRMASELNAQSDAAGHDLKKLRALSRNHDRWSARYPEIYEEWWQGQLREAAASIDGMFDIGGPQPPKLKVIKS